MEALTSDGSSGKSLLLTLRRRVSGGDWILDSAQFRFPSHYYRLNFSENVSMQAALCQPLNDAIAPFLPTSDQPHVVSAADKVLMLPGLVLKGMRVLTHRVHDGIQSVLVRFTDAMGDMRAALRPAFRDAEGLKNEREDLAIRTLVDLVNPCLDIFDHAMTHALTAEQARVIHARVQSLAEHRNELALFAEMLRRFVDDPEKLPSMAAEQEPQPVLGMEALAKSGT